MLKKLGLTPEEFSKGLKEFIKNNSKKIKTGTQLDNVIKKGNLLHEYVECLINSNNN